MEWRRAWYEGSLRKEGWIDVKQAISLRFENTKAGDTYCCQCKVTRISPVNSIKRVRHFRRHRKSTENKSERKTCKRTLKSIAVGEGWKHRQIVDEIVHYLGNDGKKLHNVNLVKDAKGVLHDEPDIVVTHSSTLEHFDSLTTHVLVRFNNWRRQQEVIQKYPNSIVIEAHRWQGSEVGDANFEQYVRKKIDQAYSMTKQQRSEFLEKTAHKTFIPNYGFWNKELPGNNLQRTLEISSNETDSKKNEALELISDLIERVKEHNMWAISKKGMHKYHLKYLEFQDYLGVEIHIDPCIDAIISHMQSINTDFAMSSIGTGSELFMNVKGIGNFSYIPMSSVSIATEIPGLWEWSDLTIMQKNKCITKAKAMYYRELYPKDFNFGLYFCVTPLLSLELDKQPQILSDLNGIYELCSNYNGEKSLEFNPLSVSELRMLQYMISAERWISSSLRPHHPDFDNLLHERIHSTDPYDRKRIISIPYSISKKLEERFGREPNETELKSLLEAALEEE